MAITKKQVKKSDKNEPNKEFEAFFKHYAKRENMSDLYDNLKRVQCVANLSVGDIKSAEWRLGFVFGRIHTIIVKSNQPKKK